ncbi:MAG: hypothetical protein QOI53_326 [Verrucomicrobiota bacterium]|nr:hypothetical protein [Verrucomicrobiota bacterium]
MSVTNCEVPPLGTWAPYFRVVSTFGLAPLQHLQPGGPGVFPTRRYEVTPYEGEPFIWRFPGLKPWAEFCSPFGARPFVGAPERSRVSKRKTAPRDRHSPELVRPYGRGGGGTAFDERYQAASRPLNARDILL